MVTTAQTPVRFAVHKDPGGVNAVTGEPFEGFGWWVVDTTQDGYARLEARFPTEAEALDWAERLEAGHPFAGPAGPHAPGTWTDWDR